MPKGYIELVSSGISTSPLVSVCSFPGATAGAKIQAANDAVVAAGGGIIDGNCLTGVQDIISDLTLGNGLVPITLRLNPAVRFDLDNAEIIGSSGVRIVADGLTRLEEGGTTFRRISGTKPMFSFTGADTNNHCTGWALEGLFLDGGGLAGHGIVAKFCDIFRMERVHARNGINSSAMRFEEDCWDFQMNDLLLMAWGNSTTPIVNLVNGTHAITDGHWKKCTIGDLDPALPLGMPALISGANVLQQRFVDCKFHTTGTGQVYMVLWDGYRSEWVGCTWQGAQAATTHFLKFRSADNRITGGGINDMGDADGIILEGQGQLNIVNTHFRSEKQPGAGYAIKADATSRGRLAYNNLTTVNLAGAIDSGTGATAISPGSLLCIQERDIDTPGNTGLSRSANVVTVKTISAHGLAVGDRGVVLLADDSSFDIWFTVTVVVNANEFRFAQTGSNGTSGNGVVWTPDGSSEPINLAANFDMWVPFDTGKSPVRTPYITLGEHTESPAQAGAIRTPNNAGWLSRNTADTADILVAALLTGNILSLRDGSWLIDATGHLKPGSDNTVDIGRTTTNRPQFVYIATAVVVGTNPASVGAVRIANNAAVVSRNAANSNDLLLIHLNGSDEMELKAGAWKIIAGSHLIPGADNAVDIGSTSVKVRGIHVATLIRLHYATASKPLFTSVDKDIVTQNIDLAGSYFDNSLPVSKGGTGATTAAGALGNLGAADVTANTDNAGSHNHAGST